MTGKVAIITGASGPPPEMVNHKRVERLMAAHGIVGHRPRRRRGLTKADTAEPPAPDLVGRPRGPVGPARQLA
jgi:hypothetical protein